MKKDKYEVPEWILTSSEESELTIDDEQIYYEKIRSYCTERKLTNTTIGATIIGPRLKKVSDWITRKACNVLAGANIKFITDGTENIPNESVIFASTHQGVLDGFCWIADCPKHALVVHSAEVAKALLYVQFNTGLILVTKKKENWKSRINAKFDMISVLQKGHSIIIFPETAWNLSPNKLHLPINFGFLDVAKKTGKPIVPIVMEYIYDTSGTKERITDIHIRYGKPIVVTKNDKLIEKLEEYQEAVSTIRWELIEEKGIFKRHEISNIDYINYVKSNLKNLKYLKIYKTIFL